MTRPLVLLRLEGLAVLAVAVWGYALAGASWWLFAALLFAPDLAMVGYLRGSRVGAAVYNAAHTYVGPALLYALSDGPRAKPRGAEGAVVASAAGWGLGVPIALVWAAHIGLDRALGYGLKLPTAFRDTHLGSLPTRRA